MYLTDDEAIERISSPDNLINRLEIKKLHNGGRRKGDKNIPPLIQELIAVETNRATGDKSDVAKEWGVSQAHASRLAHGIKTQAKGVDVDFKSRVQNLEEKAHEKAIDAMLAVIGVVQDKAEEIKNAKTAAKIASDLSRVTSALRPKETNQGGGNNGVVVQIYAPEQKHIDTYKTIEV